MSNAIQAMWQSWLEQRLSNDERGFTLIELLIVMEILLILIVSALPSYLGFRDRAAKRSAEANIREALPVAEQYGNDNKFSYAGMTVGALKAIDSGLSSLVVVKSATATSYCLTATVKGWKAYAKGPGGTATMTAVC